MKSILLMLLLVLPVLFGCALPEYLINDDALSARGNTPHPPGLPSVWKGRDVSELVAKEGEPDIILDTAVLGFVIYGDTPSVMYVYGPGSGSGSQGYDAYVVEHDSGEILAYQRR